MQTVLTIAGFDPSSGAGITADLMVFAAHGLFGASCITALTVQSTLGVRSTHPVAGKIVAETLACLNDDLAVAGVKIGMIANKENIFAVCDFIIKLNATDSGIEEFHRIPVVLDPVFRATSGRELLEPNALAALRDRLLPLVDWVTPNLLELSVLSGIPVKERDDVPEACRLLRSQVGSSNAGGRLGIVATGGHLQVPDDFVLTPTGEECWLPGERVETRSTHGTGCAFSSAFLSRLARGDSPLRSAAGAKAYVAGALRAAKEIGKGAGPINHLWQFVRVED